MYKLRELPDCYPQFAYGPSIPGPLSESSLHSNDVRLWMYYNEVWYRCRKIDLGNYYSYFKDLSEEEETLEMINLLIEEGEIYKFSQYSKF